MKKQETDFGNERKTEVDTGGGDTNKKPGCGGCLWELIKFVGGIFFDFFIDRD